MDHPARDAPYISNPPGSRSYPDCSTPFPGYSRSIFATIFFLRAPAFPGPLSAPTSSIISVFKRPTDHNSYNVLQRLSYLSVIFLFFPLMIITGFAMSPAITSVFPQFVTVFGGQQTARTLHFFIANFLVLFLLVHIAMVILAGFTARMRAMITGRNPAAKEPS